MTERVRPSVAKQEALMRLMSSDPSLMGTLDDDLLASITLASEPVDARAVSATAAMSSRKSKSSSAATAAAAARHTLLDQRRSLENDLNGSGSSSSNKCQSAASSPARRAKVQLYTQAPDAAPSSSHATKKHALLHSVSAPEPSSSAKDSRRRANGVTRANPDRPPQRLLSLLDDSVFAAHGDLKSTTKSSKTTAVQQSPLPPSVSSSRTGATIESRVTKAKANNRRGPQVPLPPTLWSVEQQYEFGGSLALRSSLSDTTADADNDDAADQSAIESTHSSSHGSNDSDESCVSMSSVSMQDTGSSSSHATRTGVLIDLPPPATSARAKSSALVMDHRCFVARDQWVPKSARKSCSVCERDFNVLRKRHSCRMCGEVICSRCSVFRAVNLSVVEGKCRICSCCSVSYRKKLDELAAGAADAMASPAAPSADVVDASAPLSMASPPLTASSLSTLLTSTAPTTADPEDAIEDDECAKASYDSDLSTLLSGDCSFSSPSISCASDVSLASFASSSSSSRNIEAELEAALKARQLEKEVEASRSRIRELEVTIAEQENQQERLSTEQQTQLTEARRVISLLQAQLQQQEVSAREAAATRDTICLSNLRQAESYATDDDESRALKKKLKVLERQLQLAGINVAEVIPYDVAKAKVAEIARRLQEIGSSEVVLDDKVAQAAARKEYYKLEQDMEKYNTALVMTDEYIEEERRKEQAFEDAHCVANAAALALLRSAIPVEISRLSEQQLKQLATPSGAAFPPELAKRLKRTNVLQLVRVAPSDIVRMHPSVIEGFRTTGLTLLERRALHVVMQTPFREWKRQQMDELSQKKFQWYKKLRDALVSAVASYEQHCASVETPPNTDAAAHSCKLLGLSCPVRAEARVKALYATGLGFPATDVYYAQEVIKSDPDGAGEKALQEAQSYAREAIANQRQRELKAHYRTRMRDVAMAMGALEEVDAALERLETLDAPCVLPPKSGGSRNDTGDRELTSACESIIQTTRELVLLLAKRAGICVVGKRNAANDEADTRSRLERQSAARAAAIVSSMLDDVDAFFTRTSASGSALRYVRELLTDVQEKNRAHAAAQGDDSEPKDETSASSRSKRVPWSERPQPSAASSAAESTDDAVRIAAPPTRPSPAAVLPTSASLFDAIRARKQQKQTERTASESDERSSAPTSSVEKASAPVAKAPLDLFAAIRARQAKLATPDASTTSA